MQTIESANRTYFNFGRMFHCWNMLFMVGEARATAQAKVQCVSRLLIARLVGFSFNGWIDEWIIY